MAASMLDVPDELFLDIALRTGSPERANVLALQALSLTCRRLRPIAQEALVRAAPISITNVWRLVEVLGAHPDLTKSLTHLRLEQLDQDMYDAIEDASLRDVVLIDEEHKACRAVVPNTCPIFDVVKPMEVGFSRQEMFYSIAILVVISLSPGLKTVYVDNNFLRSFTLIAGIFNRRVFRFESWIPEWYENIRNLLEAQLDSVKIMDEKPIEKKCGGNGAYISRYDLNHFSYTPNVVKLVQFRKLKHIVAPLSSLFDKAVIQKHRVDLQTYIKVTDLTRTLPQSLESIRVDISVHNTNIMTVWFKDLIENTTAFPHLELVKFRFELNLPSMACSICSEGTRFGQKQLYGLRRWKVSTVTIKTEFGTGKLAAANEDREWVKPRVYVEGDLATAIERSLAITHTQLEQDTVLMEELGYIAPQ